MVYSKGDKILTKKPHACGKGEWTIIRTGADIKIRCDNCSRIVLISLAEFPKIIKRHIAGKSDEQ